MLISEHTSNPPTPQAAHAQASHAVWGLSHRASALEAYPKLAAGQEAAAGDLPCSILHHLDDAFTGFTGFYRGSCKCSVSYSDKPFSFSDLKAPFST